jgi:hypothetical protein
MDKPSASIYLSRSARPPRLTKFLPDRAPCASQLTRDAAFRKPRRIKHNSNQIMARHQNKILLLTCLIAHFGHTSAQRLQHTSRCYRDYPVATGSDHLRGAVAANNKHPGFSDPRGMIFFELPRVLFHLQWAHVVCRTSPASISLSRSDAPHPSSWDIIYY